MSTMSLIGRNFFKVLGTVYMIFCLLHPLKTLNMSNFSHNYNVLVLMIDKSPTHRFDLLHIGPAIDIAEEECQHQYHVKLNLIRGTYSNQCNETASLGNVYDVLKRDDVVALVGPACSDDVQVVGRLAAYTGVPLLTGLGDVLIKERDDFTTLIRVSYDLRDKARAILAFMTHHNWYHFGLIYRKHDVYYQTLAEELLRFLKNEDTQYNRFVCNCKESYVRDQKKQIVTDLEMIMRKMRSCTRIIVIIGGGKEVRNMMLVAYSLKMVDGDYAFIYTELIEREAIGNNSWASGPESEDAKIHLKRAYQSLMIVSLNQPPGEHYVNFSDSVKKLAKERYDYDYNEPMANYFTAAFHDSVLLLCKAIRENEVEDEDFARKSLHHIHNKILKNMKNVSFIGVSGNVTIDSQGDRVADYALLDQTDPENGLFEVVLRFYGATRSYETIREIHWPHKSKPKDFPECGFDGSKCEDWTFWEMMIVLMAIMLFVMILTIIFITKKIKYKLSLANMSWKIRWEDIERIDSKGLEKSIDEYGLLRSITDHVVINGLYRGNQVSIRKYRGVKFEMTKEILIELKIMRETSHDNLTRFIGICTDNCLAIVTEFCSKGSLRVLLANSALNLDWMFRCSIINDIVNGMNYLHLSEHVFHSRLNSNNCLIDSRFCVKISDFGLRKLKDDANILYCCADTETDSVEQENSHQTKSLRRTQLNGSCLTGNNINLVYYAPEFIFPCKCKKNNLNGYCLRGDNGSQKGDVYSFAIILQEVFSRRKPFYPYIDEMPISEIIKKAKLQNLRPIVNVSVCAQEFHTLMVNCWSSNPDERPDFYTIKSEIKNLMKSMNVNHNMSCNLTLTENLLNRMEQYAKDLEMIVKKRTDELADEKKKTEELLYQILPKPVADQLKQGKMFEPNFFDSVTIYFSDIVGFTHLCSNSTPMQVVDLLNDLYIFFDSIISDFDVYKVETIGDAYMVVSGLPEKNGIEHARQICRMALKILELLPSFQIKHRPDEKLRLRIGINTGPCCAGCVGNIRPRFCLFGDAVNIASRMESNGECELY
ncbi:FERM RhoGEF and pleckstrin domain-containing protein 1 [Sarcoptes scabiei]|nr:FERM RhoGEF and pleckstrin domain-containing protein 1 [Sarcoptes scabiei]